MARRKRNNPAYEPPAASDYSGSVPRPANFPTAFFLLIPVGLLFTLAGLAPFLAMVPWWNWMEQRNWNQTNATITQGGDQLIYEYEWRGTRFMQTTYSVRDDADTGTSPFKTAFLAKHKAGDVVPVFVNPQDPGEAVLNRDFAWEGADADEKTMMIVFFVVFGTPGLLCVFFGVRSGYRYIRDLLAYRRYFATA